MRSVATLMFLLSALSAIAGDNPPKDYSGSYMCRPLGTAGIGYNERSKEWRATTFDTAGWQHFIKFTALADQSPGQAHDPQYRSYRILVGRADLPGDVPTPCVSAVIPGNPTGNVPMFSETAVCKTRQVELRLNFNNMKYQMIEDSGYLYDLFPLMPYIQVGSCAPLD